MKQLPRTITEAAALLRRRETSALELAELALRAAHGDQFNTWLLLSDDRAKAQARAADERLARRRRAASLRHPVGVQGHHRHQGRRDDGGLEDPRGVRPAVLGDGRRAARCRGRGDDGQDEPRRVRDGQLERELRLRSGEEPVAHRSRAGRLVGRQRGRRRGGRGALRARHRHRRLDPPARRAHRRRRHEADVRARVALRRRRVRVVARSGRTRSRTPSRTARSSARRCSARIRATRPRCPCRARTSGAISTAA